MLQDIKKVDRFKNNNAFASINNLFLIFGISRVKNNENQLKEVFIRCYSLLMALIWGYYGLNLKFNFNENVVEETISFIIMKIQCTFMVLMYIVNCFWKKENHKIMEQLNNIDLNLFQHFGVKMNNQKQMIIIRIALYVLLCEFVFFGLGIKILKSEKLQILDVFSDIADGVAFYLQFLQLTFYCGVCWQLDVKFEIIIRKLQKQQNHTIKCQSYDMKDISVIYDYASIIISNLNSNFGSMILFITGEINLIKVINTQYNYNYHFRCYILTNYFEFIFILLYDTSFDGVYN